MSASDEWVYLTDPTTSRCYYANLSTRETSWLLPEALGGSGEEPLYVKLPNGWFQFQDEVTGRFYYWHKHSKRTVWVMPAEARPQGPTGGSGDHAVLFEDGMRGEAEGEGEEDEDEDEDEDEEVFEIQKAEVDGQPKQLYRVLDTSQSAPNGMDGFVGSAHVYTGIGGNAPPSGPVPNVPVPNASVAGQADEDEDEDDAADDFKF